MPDLKRRGVPTCDERGRRDWTVYGASVAYGHGYPDAARADYAAQLGDLAADRLADPLPGS